VSDTSVSDTSVSDTSVTETGVSDTSVTETSVTETSVTETNVTETSVGDRSVSDTSMSDTSMGDTSVGDTSVGDTSVSDRSVSDGSMSDRSVMSNCYWGSNMDRCVVSHFAGVSEARESGSLGKDGSWLLNDLSTRWMMDSVHDGVSVSLDGKAWLSDGHWLSNRDCGLLVDRGMVNDRRMMEKTAGHGGADEEGEEDLFQVEELKLEAISCDQFSL
jgi:hypothetical protein